LEFQWEGAPSIILANMLALGLGASVGPEAAIAAMGAASAAYATSFRWIFEHCKLTDRKRRMFVLVGMAGAIASVFPAAPIAVILIYEIFNVSEEHFAGNSVNRSDTRDYLEFITISGICASFSYAVQQALLLVVDDGYKTHSYALEPTREPFSGAAPALGMLCGLLGAGLSTLFLTCQVRGARSEATT